MKIFKIKNLTILCFSLCIIMLCFYPIDRYLRKTNIVYAAWRQPDQSENDWSNVFFSSDAPALYRLKLRGKNFTNANFTNGGLGEAHFDNVEFVGADMNHSHFPLCMFKWCDLRNVDFRGATLYETGFWHTDLRDANFAGANLRGVVFWNADLRGANFTGAQMVMNWFYNSDLRGAKLNWGKTGAILYDSQTKWPMGYVKSDMFILSNKTPVWEGGR